GQNCPCQVRFFQVSAAKLDSTAGNGCEVGFRQVGIRQGDIFQSRVAKVDFWPDGSSEVGAVELCSRAMCRLPPLTRLVQQRGGCSVKCFILVRKYLQELLPSD